MPWVVAWTQSRRAGPFGVGRLAMGLLGALATMVLVAGCGGSVENPEASLEDEDLVKRLVSDVSLGGEGGLKRFQDCFATDPVPGEAEREKYRQYRFRATDASAGGDTAEVTVEVETADETPAGEQQWTAVKVDGKWKLDQAPLP